MCFIHNSYQNFTDVIKWIKWQIYCLILWTMTNCATISGVYQHFKIHSIDIVFFIKLEHNEKKVSSVSWCHCVAGTVHYLFQAFLIKCHSGEKRKVIYSWQSVVIFIVEAMACQRLKVNWVLLQARIDILNN